MLARQHLCLGPVRPSVGSGDPQLDAQLLHSAVKLLAIVALQAVRPLRVCKQLPQLQTGGARGSSSGSRSQVY